MLGVGVQKVGWIGSLGLVDANFSFLFFLSFFLFFFFFFLGLYPWYMEVSRLGVESDL